MNTIYHLVHGIDHMSDLHIDNSFFYKRSMKINRYAKVEEWIDSSIGQSIVIQRLDKERLKLSNLNQTQNRRRYINFENGSRFNSSLNFNNPELTVFIAFKMTDIATGNKSFVNTLIGNISGEIAARHMSFYRAFGGLGLFISKVYDGAYIAIANDESSLIPAGMQFPSSKSNCTDLNK